MANVNNSIFGDVVDISISTDLVTPDYKLVVCSSGTTGIAWGSTGGTETATRCGTARAAGRNSITITFEGVYNTSVTADDEMSGDELAALKTSGASFLVKVEDTGTPANYYRQGQGVLSDYSESAPIDGFVSFSGTIAVSGELDVVV